MTALSNNNQDTIAAIATAAGQGGVGIIRLSGPKALTIGLLLSNQTQLTPRYAHYGSITDKNELIDQGITLYFPAPHSFTGEDVVEFQIHGGPVVLDRLLQTTIKHGARLAKPGEFSERAFLNDKIDLTQAEAIADLISATSEHALKQALSSLQGVFSERINHLVDQVTHLRMYVEAAIDFPEEEVDFLQDENIKQQIDALLEDVDAITSQAKQGVLTREGVKVVIAGKPNAGKSSLLNALSGNESAIVTNIAGTTRDIVREHITIDGLPLHIIDTAGLRESDDVVEQMGIERAWQEMLQADRILLLIDIHNTSSLEESIADFIEEINQKISSKEGLTNHTNIDTTKISIVCNKIDQKEEQPKISSVNGLNAVFLSAKTGQGMELLTKHLHAVAGFENTTEGGFIARRRHVDALLQAKEALLLAQQQWQSGSGELLAEDLKICQNCLGEITGRVSPDALLGKIFSSFCIGK